MLKKAWAWIVDRVAGNAAWDLTKWLWGGAVGTALSTVAQYAYSTIKGSPDVLALIVGGIVPMVVFVAGAVAFARISKKRQEVQAMTTTLERRESGRRLSDEQSRRLIKQLSTYRGNSISITIYTESDEAENYAAQFWGAFQAAGWPVERKRIKIIGYHPPWLGLSVQDRNQLHPKARIVLDAFKQADIELSIGLLGSRGPERPDEYMELTVI